MKRFFLWSGILILIYTLGAQKLQKKIPVWNEIEEKGKMTILKCRQINCTSRNLEFLFPSQNPMIYRVYPKNNLSIVDERINQKLSSFVYSNKETLEKDYLMILEFYGLLEDIEKVKRYGILIDKIEVFSI